MFVEVRVYSVTGHSHPSFPFIIFVNQAMAPWWREMWLGWEEMPWRSKVMRMSIVDVGASLPPLSELDIWVLREDEDEGVVVREDAEVELRVDFRMDLEGIAGSGFGVNAEDRTEDMPAAGQVVVILSGKAGSSIMKISAGERRPRRVVDWISSRFRVSPRPSAFPRLRLKLPSTPFNLFESSSIVEIKLWQFSRNRPYHCLDRGF